MRGRKKEPDGKRVTICAKVSEAEAALIDAARGTVSRSEWIRSAALATTLPAEEDCPHPEARINKGLCGACGTYVGIAR